MRVLRQEEARERQEQVEGAGMINYACPHCGSTKDAWFSRTIPMCYVCPDCENDIDEQPKRKERAGMKHNKFNAKKSTNPLPELAGRRFDSQLERNRATELVLLQRAKDIRNLRFQEMVYLTAERIGFRCDFYYEERVKPRVFRPVYEDAKGFETPRWRIIKRLWKHYGPGKLRVTKDAGGGRIKTVEEIISLMS